MLPHGICFGNEAGFFKNMFSTHTHRAIAAQLMKYPLLPITAASITMYLGFQYGAVCSALVICVGIYLAFVGKTQHSK